MSFVGWLLVIAVSGLFSAGHLWAAEQADNATLPPPPPLLVSGTIISPSARMALIATLDGQGKPVGERRVHEGEAIDGYRVATIQQEQVIFERDGQTFSIRVGNDRQPAPTIGVVVPYERKREISGRFVPAPDNIEEWKTQADSISERLRRSPAFQKGLEDLDRRLGPMSEPRQANP
jgi:type II secretory pathway component PulC